jgi:hypothetical protein
MYRFLSKNEAREVRKETEEEQLLAVVAILRDTYEIDKEKEDIHEEGVALTYEMFNKKAKQIAMTFKDSSGYRRLLCVEPFSLGLVMASRIRRHYTHAAWFKIGSLMNMLGVHGAVRNITDG